MAGKWKAAELLMLRPSVDYTVPGTQAFLTAIKGMLYACRASTLDMYLKTTGLLYARHLRRVSAKSLTACAEYCSEKKMSVFLDNGANFNNYAPDGETLFQWAYKRKMSVRGWPWSGTAAGREKPASWCACRGFWSRAMRRW